MNIENLPKGCIPDSPDERDFSAEPLMGAVKIDFSQEFRLPEPPDTDQGQADSCVGHAWSYYHWQLDIVRYAVKSIFAYIAQAYGASIRDGGLRIVKNGQETLAQVPDPIPETPQNMRDKTGLREDLALQNREFDSFVLPNQSIDGVAWGIKNYKGVVFGVQGTNAGWQDMKNPVPPAIGEPDVWGHALYAMGYHIHADGQKCIIAKSSWCNSVKEHHIRENYFISGNTFNAWTLIPKEQMSNQAIIVKSKKSQTVYICYPVPDMDYLTKTSNLQGILVPATIPDSDAL